MGEWKHVFFCIIVPKSNTEIMRPISQLPDLFFLISLDPHAGFISVKALYQAYISVNDFRLNFPIAISFDMSLILFSKYVFCSSILFVIFYLNKVI